MLLNFPMISREHMFNGLFKFISGSPSRWVTNLPCLAAVGLVQMDIKVFIISHDLIQNHVIEEQELYE